MEYPNLRAPSQTRQMIDVFGGYNHSLRIGDGEFYQMQNMSSDGYPVLMPRKPRRTYRRELLDPQGLAFKNALCYTLASPMSPNMGFFCLGNINEEQPLRFKSSLTGIRMISMGAYVIIQPCNMWFNTAKYDPGQEVSTETDRYGAVEASWTLAAGVTAVFSPCRADGTVYTEAELPEEKPQAPKNGDLWLDGDQLKQWTGTQEEGLWTTVSTTYVRVDAPKIGVHFRKYDGVELKGLEAPELAGLNGANIIWALEEGSVVIQGFLKKSITLEEQGFSLKREMPEMDYVIECGNRLWGCRYGKNKAGQVVNEIYCSKLGDFTNWSCFMGISTDSATLQLGSDGPFTGAVCYMGYPIFFKENVLHKVYISPNGAHRVADTPCQGVQPGCSKSLAVVGDTLLYKSRNGIMAYDGSVPVALPSVFGNERYTDAVAGAFGRKYYISMTDERDDPHLFVYDTEKGLWHREDALRVRDFAAGEGKLYAIVDNAILILAGDDAPGEETVDWSVQTGQIGMYSPDRKYLSRLNVRLWLEAGATAALYVRCDFSDAWEHLYTATGNGLGSFDIPVRPKRCDHFYLRLEGSGQGKLYSITKTVEQGSEVP